MILSRPNARNAVDGPTGTALCEAFEAFDADDSASVAVLWGEGGTFCAGADLKSFGTDRALPLQADGRGPMGPTRLRLDKPVIAAISGHAVAGGLELALWCDMRVATEDTVFGVFCRRWGVPLVDGGTVRLPRLIGTSVAMDMVLTGRPVEAQEAQRIGLANRVVPTGEERGEAETLAAELTRFPQTCLRQDRLSVLEQHDMLETTAFSNEWEHGMFSYSADAQQGASRFAAGAGRSGTFDRI